MRPKGENNGEFLNVSQDYNAPSNIIRWDLEQWAWKVHFVYFCLSFGSEVMSETENVSPLENIFNLQYVVR